MNKQNHIRSENYFSRETQWHYGQPPYWDVHKSVEIIDIDTKICKKILESNLSDNARKLAFYFHYEDFLADLEFSNICEKNFKNENYLMIEMVSKMKYNDARITDFDISKKLFVYPVIDYIKTVGSNFKIDDQIFGLGFKIHATTEDFTRTENYSGVDYNKTGRTNVFEYFIPYNLIVNFINQNISRQELVDGSLLMINNELIDVTFQ